VDAARRGQVEESRVEGIDAAVMLARA